ncbi:MAG: hydroxymethylglutaryl-CoA lyase [Deltaproteobacteria bacterium]
MNNKITISDVTARDGLQNVSTFIPTSDKVILIEKLINSGVPEIQVGSFVSPKVIPQFADIKELTKALIAKFPTTIFNALVANNRGMEDAIANGIKKIVFFFSVSETHNLNNIHQNTDESLATLSNMVSASRATNTNAILRVDIATIFGCPFEGFIPLAHILKCVDAVVSLGVTEITLCDTVGFANPKLIEETICACQQEFPQTIFRLHLHNTRGLALANALRAYDIGIRHFDATVGGIGGCPFAPGASGNVAIEDIVFMFQQMGIDTGINLQKLFDTTAFVQKMLPLTPVCSALFHAGEPKAIGNI